MSAEQASPGRQNEHAAGAEVAPDSQDTTKAALLQAGLHLFAESGFKGTTTRMLSAHSGANISAIPYYYNSKEGLYLAVVEHIGERIGEHMSITREEVVTALAANSIDQQRATSLLEQALLSMAKLFVESEEPRLWAQIIVREQLQPTQAFNVLYAKHIHPMQLMFTQLLGVCLGINPNHMEAKLRCHLLFGQVLALLVSRESLLRHLKTDTLKKNHIKEIYQLLQKHTHAVLAPLQQDGDVHDY